MPTKHKKAKKLAGHARRDDIVRALADGYTQAVVAKRFGVTQPRISQIYHDELRLLADSRKEHAATALDAELSKLAALEQRSRRAEALALKGWRRSLTDRVKKTATQRATAGPGGAPERRVETEGQAGDPAFIGQMLRAQQTRLNIVERRSKLLGLDAPEKHALTDPEGKDVLAQAMEGLSPAVLADLHRRAADKWAKKMARKR